MSAAAGGEHTTDSETVLRMLDGCLYPPSCGACPSCSARAALARLKAAAENILPADEICACLSETGNRQVRIYERCERCHALMESDYPERLKAAANRTAELQEVLDGSHARGYREGVQAELAYRKAAEAERDAALARAETAERDLAVLIADGGQSWKQEITGLTVQRDAALAAIRDFNLRGTDGTCRVCGAPPQCFHEADCPATALRAVLGGPDTEETG